MKKTVIFIVVLGLTLTLGTATPAKAQQWGIFWPVYAVGIGTAAILNGTAAIVDSFFSPPSYGYPASPAPPVEYGYPAPLAPPVGYGGGYSYYGGPVYGYSGYHGGYHGRYHERYHWGHQDGYHWANHEGYRR